MRIILSLIFILVSGLSYSQDEKQPISPCVSEIFLPNFYRGNGDSVNDIFIPKIAGSPAIYSFQIFNRWGTVVFETKNIEEGWSGNYMNRKVDAGTYFWAIEFTCEGSDEKYKLMGYVSLIR